MRPSQHQTTQLPAICKTLQQTCQVGFQTRLRALPVVKELTSRTAALFVCMSVGAMNFGFGTFFIMTQFHPRS